MFLHPFFLLSAKKIFIINKTKNLDRRSLLDKSNRAASLLSCLWSSGTLLVFAKNGTKERNNIQWVVGKMALWCWGSKVKLVHNISNLQADADSWLTHTQRAALLEPVRRVSWTSMSTAVIKIIFFFFASLLYFLKRYFLLEVVSSRATSGKTSSCHRRWNI